VEEERYDENPNNGSDVQKVRSERKILDIYIAKKFRVPM
jgi:hypothetical protein